MIDKVEFKQVVGEQVRKIRKARGLTQEQLAEKSDLSLSYISDVERGMRNISLELLGKIIAALKITPVQLFEDVDTASEHFNDGNVSLKIDTLNLLLGNRDEVIIDFVLKMTQEFLNVVDQKKI